MIRKFVEFKLSFTLLVLSLCSVWTIRGSCSFHL